MTTQHTIARDTADARYDYLMLGEVVRNDDPMGLGRIKVLVKGLLEPESTWAYPIGAMFGIKNGIWFVPEVGANVCVFFNQGHSNHPYWIAGPWGKPGGETDVPEQAPAGSVEHMVVRWRDFHITFDGTPGAEQLTIEDLGSGTKMNVNRLDGNLLTDVEGDRVEEVAQNRVSTIEQGNETVNVAQARQVTVGADDTETIGANKTKTVTGNETGTISGNKTTTVAGADTETVGLAKTITAGLGVAISGGATVLISAGALLSLIGGAGVSLASTNPASASNIISQGVRNESFFGGVVSSITGTFQRTFNGALTWIVNGVATLTFNGLATFAGTQIRIGAGPYKKLVTEDVFSAWANTHTHGGPGAPPDQLVIPGGSSPDVDIDDVTTSHLQAS